MTESRPLYQVRATPWSGGWELDIVGVGMTQALVLADAEMMVRDYISLDLGVDKDAFDVEITQSEPEMNTDRTRRITRRGGMYFHRWQLLWPWGLSAPWKLSVCRAGDEYCNPSIVFQLPFLGALVVFWKPGRQRTEADGMCEDCLADLAKDEAEGWRSV